MGLGHLVFTSNFFSQVRTYFSKHVLSHERIGLSICLENISR